MIPDMGFDQIHTLLSLVRQRHELNLGRKSGARGTDFNAQILDDVNLLNFGCPDM